MVCEECKKCGNYKVCEQGCFGNTEPCEFLLTDNFDYENYEPAPNYWGEY